VPNGDPKVTRIGEDGTSGVLIDDIPLEDHDAQSVLKIQELYYRDIIPYAEYMKYLRRLKARAERTD
jgi:hypothetical protein